MKEDLLAKGQELADLDKDKVSTNELYKKQF